MVGNVQRKGEMLEYTFFEGNKVTIHSLGENTPGEFRGVIRGLAVDNGDNAASIYIVELVDKITVFYEFSHCAMPAACLREGW